MGRKKARCMCGENGIERSAKHEDNEESERKKKGKKGRNAVYYERSFFHSRIPLDDRRD